MRLELSTAPPDPAPRRRLAGLVVAGLVAGLVAVSSTGAAPAAAAGTGTGTGISATNAGASCWGIKQAHPASADGVYWLRTPTMVNSQQFYCDMTTDGGGWVLIGRGRDGWTWNTYGQGSASEVRTVVDGTGAFSPKALSARDVDALLNNTAVTSLDDGVRVRRAANASGTQWQELRWHYLDLTRFAWALDGGHRLASFTINGTGFTGGNTQDSINQMTGEVGAGNRNANNTQRWFTWGWGSNANKRGFGYGGGITGQNNASTYLWSGSNNQSSPLPFTQVFIRPKFANNAFPGSTVPDTGLPAVALTPFVTERPDVLPSGVVGVLKVGDSEPDVDAPVLAFAEHAPTNTVFVGGKFANVQQGSGAPLESQSYLAAFDASTGAWRSGFRPTFNGTVWDLALVGDRLFVAGQFTNVDGVANTAGLVALNATTGAVDTTWQASLAITGTNARPYARALDVEGTWLYVGGNFTSITTNGTVRAVPRMGRVRVSDGLADTAYRPDIDGTVYDVDADSTGRVYIAGDFYNVNGTPKVAAAVTLQSNGQLVAGMADYVYTAASPDRRYQQVVHSLGDKVWLGGSEHNVQLYRASDFGLLKSNVTLNQGGDTQALAQNGTFMFAGSHANAWVYQDAVQWPTPVGYTRQDQFNWLGAFDAQTGTYVRDWVPQVATAYSEGTWALFTDSRGCLWFGGDFNRGAYVGGVAQYLQSFSRFCQRDTTPPSVPTNLNVDLQAAGGPRVTWSASTDNAAGFIGYEVLRDDQVVSNLVYGTSFVDTNAVVGSRYFVRAVDATGNRSATTAVKLAGADTTKPTVPTNLAATVQPGNSVVVTWNASTDNIGVTGYELLRNGVVIQTLGVVTTTTVTGLPGGNNYLQLRAFDAAGNRSSNTASVIVNIVGPDTTKPSVPTNLAAALQPDNSVVVTWNASTDNIGVTGYELLRNGVVIQTLGVVTTTTVTGLPGGNNYLQLRAFDAAGNRSSNTASVIVNIVGPDTTKPSVPTALAGTVQPDSSVVLTWNASTDNIGVTGYEVLRNGAVVATVATPGATLTGQPVNVNNYYQVRAFDAAGNKSANTASVVIVVPGPDTTKPTVPKDLAATVTPPNTVVLTWTASTDNIGVAGYEVYRNGVLATTVTTPTATLTGLTGNNYYQVLAFDAAGNKSAKTASALVTL